MNVTVWTQHGADVHSDVTDVRVLDNGSLVVSTDTTTDAYAAGHWLHSTSVNGRL